MHQQSAHEDDITLLDYWRVLVKRKRLIGYIVGAALVVSVVVSLVLPKAYSATAKVMPPQQNSPIGASILAGLPGGLSGLAGQFLGTGDSSSVLWAEILTSQSVMDAVIRRFDLMAVYDEDTIEDTRKRLENNLTIEKTRGGIISVSVVDRSGQRASDMANAFVEELDRINKTVVMSSGGRARVFVEKSLQDVKKRLAEAEDALAAFQEKKGTVKIDEQAETIIKAMGEVKGKLMAKEVALRTLLSYASPSNPEVGILRSEVAELKEELRKMEEGGGDGRSRKSIFIPTAKIPDIALEYARLLREVKIQETVFELLTAQYEQARIQEAKDSSTVQVLDRALVPTKKAKPKRRLIVLASTLAAALIGMLAAFFAEYLESEKAGRKQTAPTL